MRRPRPSFRLRLALLAVLLLAGWLRLHRLGAQSFWNDEGNSARLSERSLPLIIEGAAADVHPPLYYLALHGWRSLGGSSEFSLRLFSAYAGLLTVAGVYALGRRLGARSGAAVAALVAAANPALVYYSQEARMYALLGLLGLFSTLWLWHWLQHGGRAGLAYLLATAAALYTHYFYPVALLWQGGMVLWAGAGKRSWRVVWLWLGLVAGAGLLYLPWLPVVLRQLDARGRTGETVAQFAAAAGRWLVLGQTIGPEEGRWPLLAFVALALLAVVVSRPAGGQAPPAVPLLLALAGALLPPLAMFASGATRPAFAKFLILAVPFLCFLLGWGAEQSRRWPLAFRAVLLPLVLLAAWGTARSLQNLYGNPAYARADYRGMAARIAAEGRSDAGIILDAPNQWEVFTYYYRHGAPVYPIPRSDPDPAKIDAELSQIVAGHGRLYALFWGEAERDPQRLVEKWLDSHAFKATDEWVGDVRFVTYAVPAAPITRLAVPLDLSFGQAIRLDGYTLASGTVSPGDIIQVALFWHTEAPLAQRYKVFLHLVGPGGLVAQRDSEPGGDLALTTTWPVGQQVVDQHGVLLPASLPPGRYQLLLGLYPLGDPAARLPVSTPEGVVDAYLLAQIQVK